ncbi:hypothetical protein [Chitinophaga varians]|uniref:hypothetical protein n=1 Tax=Chitinophaga varians TaxID=2202339 RepID=UPI00165FAAC5|nr:hypothetical protein [Chitinophaga varians]MBC9909929.1 hypothetical protein [Chitinophaga varians]
MKITTLLTALSIGYFPVVAQSTKLFEIIQTNVPDTSRQKSTKDFSGKTRYFFEDEDYVVNKTCSGEWGGTVYFRNRKTGMTYVCEATCPVIIHKLNGKYLVSCTLKHLSGSSSVIQIDHPDSLQVYTRPVKGKRGLISVRDAESASRKGCITLLEAGRIIILVSFPYKGRLYHITTDDAHTYVSKIEDGRFVHLDVVSDKSLSTFDGGVITTKDDHYIVFFHENIRKGYLDISGNRIEVNTYPE